jgi:hypothetical protein
VARKRRNRGWGCPRIAQQISWAFGVEIDKDVVRRVRSVPYRPKSDWGGERLIGTIRREYLDRILFWTTADLEAKRIDFQHYYNGQRTASGARSLRPNGADGEMAPSCNALGWQAHPSPQPLARSSRFA